MNTSQSMLPSIYSIKLHNRECIIAKIVTSFNRFTINLIFVRKKFRKDFYIYQNMLHNNHEC